MGYGTGAIMGVPAHDERDLGICPKVRSAGFWRSSEPPGGGELPTSAYTGDGVAINSPLIDGLATRRSEKAHHCLAGRTGSRPAHRAIQIARLAFLPAALLGRAVPDRLARRKTSKPFRKPSCRSSRHRSMISNRPARGTASGPGEGMGPLFGERDARTKHHAAMGGLVLVLPAFLRSAKR